MSWVLKYNLIGIDFLSFSNGMQIKVENLYGAYLWTDIEQANLNKCKMNTCLQALLCIISLIDILSM